MRSSLPFDLFARRQRHCDRRRRHAHRRRPAAAAAAAGHQPRLLEQPRVRNLRRQAAQIAGRRMARRAFRVEVRLSGGGVADDDARRLETGLVVAGGTEGVQERRDVGHLRVRKRELRHAGAPGTDDRRDQLSVVVGEDDLRAQQARPAVAAAGVGAVAELAVDAVERLAALDRRGIARRTHRIVEAPLRRCRGRGRGRLRGDGVGQTHHDEQRGSRRTRRADPHAAGAARSRFSGIRPDHVHAAKPT